MTRHHLAVALLLVALLTAEVMATDAEQATAQYVGVELCRTCHEAEAIGNQVARWTGSPHARSYLALATGATEMIDRQARGMVNEGYGRTITEQAERLGSESNCLACHATGAGSGERQTTFHSEDGVQCETCHGPGSYHVAARLQGNTEQATLRRLPLAGCLGCHREKTSHAVLQRPPFDAAKAWKEIAHPLADR